MQRITDMADGQFMSETSDGPYVRYADAVKVIADLTAANHKLSNRVSRLKRYVKELQAKLRQRRALNYLTHRTTSAIIVADTKGIKP